MDNENNYRGPLNELSDEINKLRGNRVGNQQKKLADLPITVYY